MRDLIRNHLTVTLRFLWRNKIYSLINILGLSFGLACSFIVLLYVTDELKYDKHFENSDRIYRILNIKKDFNNYTGARSSYLLAELVEEHIPEVEKVCKINFIPSTAIDTSGQVWLRGTFSAGPSVFKLFDIKILHGNVSTALQTINDIAISRSASKKHFGTVNSIGKEIRININNYQEKTFVVKAVFEDLPKHSSFRPRVLFHQDISYINIKKFNPDIEKVKNNIEYTYISTFLLLTPQAITDSVERKINQLATQHSKGKEYNMQYTLQNLEKIRLHSQDIGNDFCRHGSLDNVRYYTIIGFIILIISCFNFSLLNLAKSTTRIKEIGIRKVAGASRKVITRQILSESLLIAFIAFPNALLLTELMLPSASNYLNKSLEINYTTNLSYILALFVTVIGAGLLAGSYMAGYMAKFNPIHLFRSGIQMRTSRSFFRKSMITLQLIIFISLLSIVIIISRQIHYMLHKDLGLSKENLVIIYGERDNSAANLEFLKAIKSSPSILNATAAYSLPPDNSIGLQLYKHPKNPSKKIEMEGFDVDYDFLDTYNIKLKEGRNFSPLNRTDDSLAVIINEKAVSVLELGDTALNSKFNGKRIIGIVKDFHIHTLHMQVKPTVIYLYNGDYNYMIAAKLRGEDFKQGISFIREQWKRVYPGKNFTYYSFNDSLKQWYEREFDSRKAFTTFSAFAIFIALLGLFGFTLFTVERRRKEIAIRKTQGAGIKHIVQLISKEFLVLTFFAGVLSVPLSYFFMEKWLERFVYRISIGPLEFIAAFFATSIIVFITVSLRAVLAAKQNPVKYLKNE